MNKPWLAVMWFFLFWCPSLALASPVTDEAQPFFAVETEEASQASFFEAAAREVDVPPELTRAIARVESGGTPYALNVEGRGYFFDSKEEALAAASEAQAAGKSFDSGIMQINNWWLKRYDIPLEAVFDPAANILLGSWILRQELDRHGDTWTAVARYHSPNADRGNQYVALVRRALEKGAVKTKKSAPGIVDTDTDTDTDTDATIETAPKLVSIRKRAAEDDAKIKRPKEEVGTTGPLVVYRGIPKTAKPVFSRTRPGQPGHYQEELVAQNRVFVRRQP
jgi:hypothetical protein